MNHDGYSNLRSGYTTGTCSVAASLLALHKLQDPKNESFSDKSALVMLPNGEEIIFESAVLTKGESEELDLSIEQVFKGIDELHKQCPLMPSNIPMQYALVRKDAGDDADITHQTLIGSAVYLLPRQCIDENFKARFQYEFVAENLFVTGGYGVGVVTLPGLSVPVGSFAINPAPRKMLLDNLRTQIPEGFVLFVHLFLPSGRKLASKTYNAKLGIKDGISIIGTTGIVRPMDDESFRKAILVELNQKKALDIGHLVIVPGKHGENAAKSMGHHEHAVVHASNHIGFAIKQASSLGFKKISIVGHIGKLVKLAGGIFNTHSKVADARKEIFVCFSSLYSDLNKAQLHTIYTFENSEQTTDFLLKNNAGSVLDEIAKSGLSRVKEFAGAENIRFEIVLFDIHGKMLASARDW